MTGMVSPTYPVSPVPPLTALQGHLTGWNRGQIAHGVVRRP